MRIAIVNVIYFSSDKHLELAKGFWESVQTEHEIIKIASVNKCLDAYTPWLLNTYDYIIHNAENRLAIACNKAFKLALEYLKVDYVFYCNTDTILDPNCIDNIIEFAEAHGEYVTYSPVQYKDLSEMKTKEAYWAMEDGYDATAFLFNNRLIEKVGLFPESYRGAYFEDNYLASLIVHKNQRSVKFSESRLFHYGSQTIMNDDTLRHENDGNYAYNNYKYKIAWGGDPGHEKWIK